MLNLLLLLLMHFAKKLVVQAVLLAQLLLPRLAAQPLANTSGTGKTFPHFQLEAMEVDACRQCIFLEQAPGPTSRASRQPDGKTEVALVGTVQHIPQPVQPILARLKDNQTQRL